MLTQLPSVEAIHAYCDQRARDTAPLLSTATQIAVIRSLADELARFAGRGAAASRGVHDQLSHELARLAGTPGARSF